MSKIRSAFENGKEFIPFITCGDPNLETTEKIVRDFQAVISKEIKEQMLEKEHRLPDAVLALSLIHICIYRGDTADYRCRDSYYKDFGKA